MFGWFKKLNIDAEKRHNGRELTSVERELFLKLSKLYNGQFNLDKIRSLISQGPSLSIKNASGLSPILVATTTMIEEDEGGAWQGATNEHTKKVLQLLVRYGASLNEQEPVELNTCTNIAVSKSFYKLADMLLDLGANPAIKNKAGKTTLDILELHLEDEGVPELLQKARVRGKLISPDRTDKLISRSDSEGPGIVQDGIELD